MARIMPVGYVDVLREAADIFMPFLVAIAMQLRD
jgi:hypothetical protein